MLKAATARADRLQERVHELEEELTSARWSVASALTEKRIGAAENTRLATLVGELERVTRNRAFLAYGQGPPFGPGLTVDTMRDAIRETGGHDRVMFVSPWLRGDWRVVQFTPEPGVVLAPAWGPAEGRNGLAITVHDVGLACLTEGPF
jgi:hypothetical protein